MGHHAVRAARSLRGGIGMSCLQTLERATRVSYELSAGSGGFRSGLFL